MDDPRYTVKVGKHWFPDMLGAVDTAGSTENYAGIFGFPIIGIAIEGVHAYRFKTKKNGWTDILHTYEDGLAASDDSEIIGLEIADSKSFLYMIHSCGDGWSKAYYSNETKTPVCNTVIDAIHIIGFH